MELWSQVIHNNKLLPQNTKLLMLASSLLVATDITARPGDAIVTVDGWLITLMDQPKVGRQGCSRVDLPFRSIPLKV